MPIDQTYTYTGNVMTTNMMYKDTEEGIAAFLEKRGPTWVNPLIGSLKPTRAKV